MKKIKDILMKIRNDVRFHLFSLSVDKTDEIKYISYMIMDNVLGRGRFQLLKQNLTRALIEKKEQDGREKR